MDLDEHRAMANDSWNWQEDGCYASENLSISHYLLDEMNHSEESFMCMMEVQTPIKHCIEFDYQTADFKGNTDKIYEECGDSSQKKRRRMLHFPNDSDETAFNNEQPNSVLISFEDREDEQVDDGPSSSSINTDLNSQWNIELLEGDFDYISESWDQTSEGWPETCFDENIIKIKTDEPPASEQEINFDEACSQQGYSSELCGSSNEKEINSTQEIHPSTLPKIVKGRKSSIGTLTKLTTSVAYPFALIKPCEVEGYSTLKDINQRLHAPPSSLVHDENSLLSYPTSAFSGKPVVVKTKIRTEGGKGSITIMRTKG